MSSANLLLTAALSASTAGSVWMQPVWTVLSQVTETAPLVLSQDREIPNFAQIAPGLYCGGMPSARGFAHLRQAGVTTIISLAKEKKYLASELATTRNLGLRFVHIPLSAWRRPTQNDIDGFLQTTNSKNGQTIFMHCVSGTDRTLAMTAIYRIAKQGWSAEQAYEEMKSNGFNPWRQGLSSAVFNFEKNERHLAQEQRSAFGPLQ